MVKQPDVTQSDIMRLHEKTNLKIHQCRIYLAKANGDYDEAYKLFLKESRLMERAKLWNPEV